ncbi:MAG: EF-hand domain-containing protein [Campylobacterota bacterium]|nr:EF-hand domain-containing protein [Campylobacterota bacterium]
MKSLAKSLMVFGILSSVAFAAPTAQEKFNMADVNNDGIITSEEFYNDQAKKMEKKMKEGKALKGVSTAPHFDQVDKNADQKITFEEYDVFHTARQKQMEKIKNEMPSTNSKGFVLFQSYDKDGNGCIDKNEFRDLYKSMK